MSSMFKKKTNAGFKPKAPIARPRPPAASQASRAPQTSATAAATAPEPTGSSMTNPTTSQSQPPQAATVETTTAPAPASESTSTGAPSSAATANANAVAFNASQPTQSTPDAPPSNQQALPGLAAQAAAAEALNVLPTPPSTQVSAGSRPTRQRPSAATPALQAPEITTSSQVDIPTEADTSTATPEDQTQPATRKPAARKPRKRAAPAGAEEDADAAQEGEEDADGNPPKKRRTRKAAGPAKPRQRRQGTAGSTPGSTADGEATPRRRARSVTPEDAENQQVDLSSMTMADLTKDLRIGKKSKVHDMLLQRERDKIAALKLKKAGLVSETDSTAATPQPEESQPRNFLDMDQSASEPTGLQYTMIGGQIVVDQSSLSLDRHERARQQQIASGAITAEMEEDDFTNHITETSFRTGSKLRGPNYWNEDDTELFYRGIGMLGTDFTLICKMFPGRNRRHVKMKFNREEKLNPVRINSVLTGKKSMQLDIEEYKHWTKSEYEPVADIMAAYQAKEAEFKEKTRLLELEKEEANRKKKEALFADDEDGEGADPADGGRKKKTKRKKKNGDDGMWGEVVEETLVEA
ncbi:hypothetical protein F5X68DRAFT_275904 [Plectosphaerella plurivora]|uniref:Myb-like domain-containing protein n=1 Tax=Plectosphaerella plurivora TaxID=936078 RepID=A0A9P9A8N9_9PEZI|nr:hypothetical protein F5X68DRAFT_275904 [Plectosphaerella plurivora]